MHSFTELVDRCAAFTLAALNEANERTIDALQTSGATPLAKTLQMIQLQKTVLAVGMFSLFEASLQGELQCRNGFKKAKSILENEKKLDLKRSFDDLYLAVNVLKHGHGESYDLLVARAGDLPFKVKLPGQLFFQEGDVSEVFALVQVDDSFVQHCADVIRQVQEVVQEKMA